MGEVMKIDEAVKVMKNNKVCRCMCDGMKYRVRNGRLEYESCGNWYESTNCIELIISDFKLVEEDKPLDSKVLYLHHEDSHGNRDSVELYPFWNKKDIGTFILNIKNIRWFNNIPEGTKQDIFIDIDKHAGPLFNVTNKD